MGPPSSLPHLITSTIPVVLPRSIPSSSPSFAVRSNSTILPSGIPSLYPSKRPSPVPSLIKGNYKQSKGKGYRADSSSASPNIELGNGGKGIDKSNRLLKKSKGQNS